MPTMATAPSGCPGCDALARLRRHLWFDQVVTSLETDDMTKAPPPLLRRLIDQACYAS